MKSLLGTIVAFSMLAVSTFAQTTIEKTSDVVLRLTQVFAHDQGELNAHNKFVSDALRYVGAGVDPIGDQRDIIEGLKPASRKRFLKELLALESADPDLANQAAKIITPALNPMNFKPQNTPTQKYKVPLQHKTITVHPRPRVELVKVEPLQNGESLVHYLRRKGLADASCKSLASLKSQECRNSIARLSGLHPESPSVSRVELQLQNPDDFARTFNALSDSIHHPKKGEDSGGPAVLREEEEEDRCEAEVEMCLSSDGKKVAPKASMSLKCKIGWVEIGFSTVGNLSIKASSPISE